MVIGQSRPRGPGVGIQEIKELSNRNAVQRCLKEELVMAIGIQCSWPVSVKAKNAAFALQCKSLQEHSTKAGSQPVSSLSMTNGAA